MILPGWIHRAGQTHGDQATIVPVASPPPTSDSVRWLVCGISEGVFDVIELEVYRDASAGKFFISQVKGVSMGGYPTLFTGNFMEEANRVLQVGTIDPGLRCGQLKVMHRETPSQLLQAQTGFEELFVEDPTRFCQDTSNMNKIKEAIKMVANARQVEIEACTPGGTSTVVARRLAATMPVRIEFFIIESASTINLQLASVTPEAFQNALAQAGLSTADVVVRRIRTVRNSDAAAPTEGTESMPGQEGTAVAIGSTQAIQSVLGLGSRWERLLPETSMNRIIVFAAGIGMMVFGVVLFLGHRRGAPVTTVEWEEALE